MTYLKGVRLSFTYYGLLIAFFLMYGNTHQNKNVNIFNRMQDFSPDKLSFLNAALKELITLEFLNN